MNKSYLRIVGPLVFAAALVFCSVSNSEDGQAPEPAAGGAAADKPSKANQPRAAKVGRKLKPQKIMAGTWIIEVSGAQSETLTFQILPVTKDRKEITGKVFDGKEISASSIDLGTPGGKVQFKTTFMGDGSQYTIKWTGTLNEDVTEITDGEYELQKNKGKFVAKRSN